MDIDLTPFSGRNFYKDLAYSTEASAEKFWEAVYAKAFPGLCHLELCTDVEKQKQGIDRLAYLCNGNVFWIDEKKRTKVYPDILLEHTSNVERGTPGWMEKDATMDYLAYAFMPIQTCYLFPWPMLRRAWLQYRDQWRRQYCDTVPGTTRLSSGVCYTTHSVAVPIPVVQAAVTSVAIINVSEELKRG